MAVVGDMLRAVSTFGPSPTSSFVDTDSTNQQHVHYTNITWSVQMLEIQGAAKIHPRQKLLSILAKCQTPGQTLGLTRQKHYISAAVVQAAHE